MVSTRSGSERLRIIPLGGIGEIGKNMMVIEFGDEMLIIDVGLAFPEEEMLGIDVVIPDMTYVLERQERVKAVLLTHGHEDHVGGLPYLLRHICVPVYGTRLTLGLVEDKLREFGTTLHPDSRAIAPGEILRTGSFTVTFFRVNHSIADCVGLRIETPAGVIVHTGDFKFDQTPVDGQVADFHRLAEFGDKGVLVILSDSTNAEKRGFTQSERVVGNALDDIFRRAKRRILVASFASNVPRIQQVITAAYEHGRKVAVVGRSMENVVEVALRLGYLKDPGVIVDLQSISRLPDDRVVLLTTGSQGEPMSALTRMAMAEHKRVEIQPGDTVVIAATAVPGNEKLVHRTIDHLFRLGAEVIYDAVSPVHVSGHASREELKLMLNLVRPKYFVPIHGEYRHLVHHAELAEMMGIPRENILIAENGTVLEFHKGRGRIAGKVQAGNVLVDGLGVGDVGKVVLKDRRQLSQDGILIVVVAINGKTGRVLSGPDIVSRGFVYVRESESLLQEAKERVAEVMNTCEREGVTDWGRIKAHIRDALQSYLYKRTRRQPMILPIILDVNGGEEE